MENMKSKCVTLAIALFSSEVFGCGYASNISELQRSLSARVEMKDKAAEMAQVSDSIFIGSVKELTDNYITFWDIVDLKGKSKEGIKLTWRKTILGEKALPDGEKTVLIVGCSGTVDYKNPVFPENIEDELTSYLVYLKGTEIIRLNEMSSFAQAPRGNEEVEWLLQGNHIKIK